MKTINLNHFLTENDGLEHLTEEELSLVEGGDEPHYGVGYAFGLYWNGAKAVASGAWDAFQSWRNSNIEKYGTAGH